MKKILLTILFLFAFIPAKSYDVNVVKLMAEASGMAGYTAYALHEPVQQKTLKFLYDCKTPSVYKDDQQTYYANDFVAYLIATTPILMMTGIMCLDKKH